MTVRLQVLLLFTLFFCATGSLVFAEETPVAKIGNVQSPHVVSPGESFAVVVSVEYSKAHYTDIAILDASTGSVLDSKDLFTYVAAGTVPYTLQLLARAEPGVWKLKASVRSWWHNAWYVNPTEGAYFFEVDILDSRNATVVLSSNLPSCSIMFDTVAYTAPSTGLRITAARDLHMIQLEQQLFLGEDVRAVFDHWTDGVTSTSRNIYVSGILELSAVYRTEFFLSVESELGEAIGSGWYPAGANVTFVAVAPIRSVEPQTGPMTVKFAHWSGDSDSTSSVAWVVMKGPKRVLANWTVDTQENSLSSKLVALSAAFLLCSLILFIVSIIRLGRRARSGLLRSRGRSVIRATFLVLLFAASVSTSLFQNAYALVPTEPETVEIGDVAWYHWTSALSDTCLIWLGGGIIGPSGITVNPYEFESYNTIHFVQDLAGHYDVLALKAGSATITDHALNRTIDAEAYPGPRYFMRQIHAWAIQKGYSYLYVVGYSVGAIAAAEETVLAAPGDWVSPNGLVLITPKFSSDLSSNARALKASLLILYGDLVPPEFTSSGDLFFQKAPEEGWRNDSWYHKEYHIIKGVEHEVFTVSDTGEYDGRVTLLTVAFIEKSKSLQFKSLQEEISRTALNLTTATGTSSQNVTVSSVSSPVKVGTDQAFKVTVSVRYDVSPNTTVGVAVFDTDIRSILSVTEYRLEGIGQKELVATLLSGNKTRALHVSLVQLIATQGKWSVAAVRARGLTIEVTDLLALTVIVGYTDVPVEIDGVTYDTRANGQVTLMTTFGEHAILAPQAIALGNASRAVFIQWNSTASSPALPVATLRDMSLLAIYRKQYYLNVTSPFGHTTGTGWYDENSVALFGVASPVVADSTTHVFLGWTGDSGSSPESNVLMNGSKNVQALWGDIEPIKNNISLPRAQLLFTVSLAILLTTIAFTIISLRSTRRLVTMQDTVSV